MKMVNPEAALEMVRVQQWELSVFGAGQLGRSRWTVYPCASNAFLADPSIVNLKPVCVVYICRELISSKGALVDTLVDRSKVGILAPLVTSRTWAMK